MTTAFWNKLIDRLDKLDSSSVQAQFLRLASERGLLETIFNALREGILVLDGDGRIVYANRASCQLLGLDEDHCVGQYMHRYLSDIDWEGLAQMKEVEWARMANREIEITYPEHRFLTVYLAPLEYRDGGSPEVIMLLRDVTQERDRTASVVESERLNAILMLAAGVAHEIGNPLNSLNIHMQLLERELQKLSADQTESLLELTGVARDEIDRLAHILSKFLKAIRPSKPNFDYHSLPDIVQETLETLSAEIRDRKVVVNIEPSVDMPPAWVDHAQVRQAFYNIIRNALQAMTDGGVLRISYVHSDRLACVVFRDTGCGIPSDRMGEMFEPFQTSKADGSGLGLMIVQRIMRDHGGSILVDSLQQGTRIQLNFQRDPRRIRLLSEPAGSAPETPEGQAE